MIKAIIVDDEPYSCDALVILLQRYCPQVDVQEVCYSGEAALEAIKRIDPQLVFLDIEMHVMNGFDMLEKLPEKKFELIITTSYNQYAIPAIRFSALDYLLKPVDREELKNAVNKAIQRIGNQWPQQLETLLQKIHQPSIPVKKIALPTMEGLLLVSIDTIISCESSSNYTLFYMKGNQRLTVCRTLKEAEELMAEFSFLRVHHSHLVNLNEIVKYVKGEGGYLIMSDNSKVNVSRSRKELLLEKLQHSML